MKHDMILLRVHVCTQDITTSVLQGSADKCRLSGPGSGGRLGPVEHESFYMVESGPVNDER